MKIKITERGWAGHFIAASKCEFRRNTLLERLDKAGKNRKFIISTIGNYKYGNKPLQPVGCDRYYETMVFESSYDIYDDIDVNKNISFNSKWNISTEEFKLDKTPDKTANIMHENVINEFLNNEDLWKKEK